MLILCIDTFILILTFDFILIFLIFEVYNFIYEKISTNKEEINKLVIFFPYFLTTFKYILINFLVNISFGNKLCHTI